MTESDCSTPTSSIAIPLGLYPGISRFALDLVRDEGDARRFIAGASAETGGSDSSPELRSALAEALKRTNAAWGNEVGESIESWSEGKAAAVVAGQQVGFAGGPLYTFAKIASLISLRRRLIAQGTPVTAFFWMATEDHDFDEVATLTLATRTGPARIQARSRPGRRIPVGSMEIPERLIEDLCAILEIDRPDWLREGITFRDSFGELVARAFPGEVVLVDSLLPELRRAGKAILVRIASELPRLQEAVANRSGEIARTGYQPQVAPAEDGRYGFIFEIDHRGERKPIRDGDGDRISSLLESAPERVSTAALGRPLVQDFVFSPAAFVGGPAEVSYYAQLGEVYSLLGLASPRVALRGHVLVAPERFVRALDRYDVDPKEVFDPVDEIILRRESAGRDDLRRRVDAMEARLAEDVGTVRELVLPSDRSLEKSLARTERRIRYHFEKLYERGERAIARYDRERHEALTRLAGTLQPGGVPQDRVIGWISDWLNWGDRMRDAMIDAAAPDSDELRIVCL